MKYRYVIPLIICSLSAHAQQMGDPYFNPQIKTPAYAAGKGPRVLIDGAHYNFHTAEERYRPFADLLKKDGYRVSSGDSQFSEGSLRDVDILVIANALHQSNERSWKLPTPSAFSPDEIKEVNKWVRAGGSLLLIADHMPFPGAARDLAETFGFQFNNGYAFGPVKGGSMRFDRESRTLKDHEITMGSSPDEKISHVVTFTGQALQGPPTATPLLVFGKECYSRMPQQAWKFKETTPEISVEGWLQGAAVEYGEGRICVFGEAAGFTAQVVGQGARKVGMNADEAKDNAQFVLNTLHWLSASVTEPKTSAVRSPAPPPKGWYEFHDQEGRAVVAKVLECDSKRGTVKLVLANGRKKQVHTSIFGDGDRDYLNKWVVARMLKSRRFAVEVDKKAVEVDVKNTYAINANTGEKSVYREMTMQEISHEISLKNNTDCPIENIKIEWCLYYFQERRERRPDDLPGPIFENRKHDLCKNGSCFVDLINVGETKIISTDRYTISNAKNVRNLMNSEPWHKQEGKAKGAWIRLSIALPDGEVIVREHCDPMNIRKLGWKL